MWRKLRASKKGQAMTEYIIIVAIIAIASIAVVTIFGKQIREIFGRASQQLAGDSTAQVQDQTTGVDNTIDNDINKW
ncbi:MAG: hypothetical protein HZA48_06270 [Planctomycetes bacterium]|nr:hypothetical protein [Planctomycetota bacterium]